MEAKSIDDSTKKNNIEINNETNNEKTEKEDSIKNIKNTKKIRMFSSNVNVRDIIYPIIAFVITALIFFITLIRYDVVGYDNNVILRGDLFYQYIPFIQNFINSVRNGESFWYSFSLYLGSGNILNVAYYVLNPFNLIYCIDGMSITVATTIIIISKLALASAFFTVFERKVFKTDNPVIIAIAVFYGLNGYSAAMWFNMMWLDAIYMLPIIVWLIFKLVDERKYLDLTFCYAYIFITNFYTAYMVGIFSFFVFILYYIYRSNGRFEIKRFIFTGIRFAVSALLGAAMCAVILLPAAYFLFSNSAADNAQFSPLTINFLDVINSLFMCEVQSQDPSVPIIYSGLPVLLFVPFYFFDRKIAVKEKILVTVLLVFLTVAIVWLPLYEAMHAFDFPNYYGFRFAFLLVFTNLFILGRELVYADIKEIKTKTLILYSLALIIFYSFMMTLQGLIYSGQHVNTTDEMLMNALFICLWCICFIIYLYNRKKLALVFTFIITFAEVLVNTCSAYKYVGDYAVTETQYNQWYYSEKEVMDVINASDKDFFRIMVDNEYSYNDGSMFDFNTFSTFSSSDCYDLRNALFHLGFNAGNRYMMNQGYTDITGMLFATKYIVSFPNPDNIVVEEGYKVDADNYVRGTVIPTGYALPVGFMVSDKVKDYTFDRNPFENQDRLISVMTGNQYDFYKDIPEDNIDIKCTAMEYSDIQGLHSFYKVADVFTGGYVSFFITPNENNDDMMACFYLDGHGSFTNSALIMNDKIGYYEFVESTTACILPCFDEPDPDYGNISIMFGEGSDDYAFDDMFFSYYNGEKLQDLYEDLNVGGLQMFYVSDDLLAGNVNVSSDRTVLFTSIPYDEDWKIYVDGVETEKIKLLENAFLGAELTEGEHEIIFQYEAKGKNEGTIISLVGGSIYIILILIDILKRNKRKDVESKNVEN